jgi:hypothetical protein
VVYGAAAFDAADSRERIRTLCREIVDVVGKDAFAVASTRRQFERYHTIWRHDRWNALAECATSTLPVSASGGTTDF